MHAVYWEQDGKTSHHGCGFANGLHGEVTRLKEEWGEKIKTLCNAYPEKIPAVMEAIYEYFECSRGNYMPSHGASHAINTAINLHKLIRRDGFVCPYCGEELIAAALLHDLVRPYEVHENNGIVPNGGEACRAAYEIAENIFPVESAGLIEKVVRYHDDPSSPEMEGDVREMTSILRVADVLDVDEQRVLAAVGEYRKVNGYYLSREVIRDKLKRKAEFDVGAIRKACMDADLVRLVERHYSLLLNRIEVLLEKEEQHLRKEIERATKLAELYEETCLGAMREIIEELRSF